MKLLGALDAALPDCWWKKRFTTLWKNLGLQQAWDLWRSEAPIINPEFIPHIETALQELKQWPYA